MHSDVSSRCDIVIPVWNNLEMTRECVDSIKRHTAYPYRMVIIDNASDAPMRGYLDSLARCDGERVAIIRNEENRGFVKAVNQGMRYSDAAYVCIMNNDTLVTGGWLEEMIDILRENDAIGLINPSSNTSGQFPGKLEINDYAATLKYLKGEYQELYTGRAFAMIVKRVVIDRIGYLDEIYGMGYFDDTDYCKRAQQLGYKIVRAKASYVYHRESQSFSKVKEKSAIFLENEKKFNSRWGRYLRIAYILKGPWQEEEIEKISSNINRLVRMGHQVWAFMGIVSKPRLDLIDHEGIRFFRCFDILFTPIVFYKIWKRKRKKKVHLILTNREDIYNLFNVAKDRLGAEIYLDSDYLYIEKKVREMSKTPS